MVTPQSVIEAVKQLMEYDQADQRSKGASRKHEPAWVRDLRTFIGREVNRQLLYRLEAQNEGIVEELQDKFNYLVDTYGMPRPSAAEIAMWKAEQDKKHEGMGRLEGGQRAIGD